MSSINHYTSPPESLWWSSQYTVQQQQQQQSSSPTKTSSSSTIASAAMLGRHGRTPHTFNLNNYDDEEQESLVTEKQFVNLDNEEYMKQPLFEKALTPSDVGKLNRLVIPKQHAEKYFPINGGDNSDKGLLLSFEDEVGKFWKFRYSYWNSSQSYVLTKGWSKFVKEKRLDAGDVVLFFRHRVDSTRLFIGWRRRSTGGGEEGGVGVSQGSGGGVGGVWNRGFYSTLGPQQQQQLQHPYPNQSRRSSTLLPYQTDHCLHAAGSILQNQTTTTTSVSGNSKTVRLFGVNLECQADVSEPSTPDGSPMSGQGQAHMINPYHQFYTNHQNHMDMIINFSGGGGDVYRQG